MTTNPTTLVSARTFMRTPFFAVLGASSNPAKYGHKVFSWYISHSLPATPVNPTSPSIILSPSSTHPTVPSLSALPHPSETAVSIITPPSVTRKALEEAKTLGISRIWMQPGSFDDSVEELARKEFEVVVAGYGGGTVGGEGWCILVDGGEALKGRIEGKM